MKPLPANIFEIYCADKDAGDWHPAQANYYAGFRAGAATRDTNEKDTASTVIKAFAAGVASCEALKEQIDTLKSMLDSATKESQSFQAIVKDLKESETHLQLKINAMCDAIPNYHWNGDAEKEIAAVFAERGTLQARVVELESENSSNMATCKGIIAGLTAELAASKGQVAEHNYVQPVPDHCDRITWRNSYYHLPLAVPIPPVQEVVMANNDEVICPNCCNQFRAIPVNVQRLMLDAGFKPPFKSVPCGYKLVPITLLERALQAISATMFGTETYYKSSRGDFTNVVEKEIRAIIKDEP